MVDLNAAFRTKISNGTESHNCWLEDNLTLLRSIHADKPSIYMIQHPRLHCPDASQILVHHSPPPRSHASMVKQLFLDMAWQVIKPLLKLNSLIALCIKVLEQCFHILIICREAEPI